MTIFWWRVEDGAGEDLVQLKTQGHALGVTCQSQGSRALKHACVIISFTLNEDHPLFNNDAV